MENIKKIISDNEELLKINYLRSRKLNKRCDNELNILTEQFYNNIFKNFNIIRINHNFKIIIDDIKYHFCSIYIEDDIEISFSSGDNFDIDILILNYLSQLYNTIKIYKDDFISKRRRIIDKYTILKSKIEIKKHEDVLSQNKTELNKLIGLQLLELGNGYVFDGRTKISKNSFRVYSFKINKIFKKNVELEIYDRYNNKLFLKYDRELIIKFLKNNKFEYDTNTARKLKLRNILG